MEKYLLYCQGLYYFVTGIWPIISIRTFQLVTGPKTDLWLVKMVGALAAVIGLALIIKGISTPPDPGTVFLAMGSAFAFICIDVYYVIKKTIPPGYLLDAFAELLFLIGWILWTVIA